MTSSSSLPPLAVNRTVAGGIPEPLSHTHVVHKRGACLAYICASHVAPIHRVCVQRGRFGVVKAWDGKRSGCGLGVRNKSPGVCGIYGVESCQCIFTLQMNEGASLPSFRKWPTLLCAPPLQCTIPESRRRPTSPRPSQVRLRSVNSCHGRECDARDVHL